MSRETGYAGKSWTFWIIVILSNFVLACAFRELEWWPEQESFDLFMVSSIAIGILSYTAALPITKAVEDFREWRNR